jgi:hypothetical protein
MRSRQRRSSAPKQLAAALWGWLALHEQCIAHAAGSSGFDMIATIPSVSGRAEEHPLTVLVGGVVENTPAAATRPQRGNVSGARTFRRQVLDDR